MAKHTPKLRSAVYISKSGNLHDVVVDKYSGSNYKIVKAPSAIEHYVGKTFSGRKFKHIYRSVKEGK